MEYRIHNSKYPLSMTLAEIRGEATRAELFLARPRGGERVTPLRDHALFNRELQRSKAKWGTGSRSH